MLERLCYIRCDYAGQCDNKGFLNRKDNMPFAFITFVDSVHPGEGGRLVGLVYVLA